MAQVIPCVQGTMGSTTCYEGTMTARELVSSVRPATELDDWANLTIEERMQRELSKNRIQVEIVPYLTKSKDRLWGSLIVLVQNGKVHFESFSKVVKNLPVAYRSVGEKVGFLTIEGGELIALDGQHRLVALREVIQGKAPAEGEYASAVPKDDISVMFIHFEDREKTRRIFNKVNRHAKPTSRGDNIITSEDDGYAIVTRRLLSEGAPLGPLNKVDLVNWRSNTLSPRSTHLTTISAVYEIVKYVLAHEGVKDLDEKHRVNRPTDPELQKAYAHVERWWRATLNGIKEYQSALRKVAEIPKRRADNSPSALLFKPIAQIALFKGLILAVERSLDLDEALRRANKIDWTLSALIWKDVLVNPAGRIMAKKESYELGAELIAYLLAAEKMSDKEVKELKLEYNRARGNDQAKGDKMEPLPKPVGNRQAAKAS